MNPATSILSPLRGLRVDLSTAATPRSRRPEGARLPRRTRPRRPSAPRAALRGRTVRPGNPLIFATGPLTGTGAPAAGRYSVSARSPLTGTVFDGNSGGASGSFVPPRLDYLLVEGPATAPSYLLVGDGGAGAVPAPAACAMASGRRPAGACDVPASLARLRELHPDSEAGVIGPAGERGVLFASIVNNRGRSVGRGGLGAVMGANAQGDRRAGHGERRPPVADAERFAFVVYEAEKLLKANPITSQALPEFGTSVLVNVLNQAGALPTRNFRESQFEHAEAISGEALRNGYASARAPAAAADRLRAAHRDRRRERRRSRVREHLGARRRLRRRRPQGDRRGQLRLQPRRHRHDHHGLDDRLRDGARRGRRSSTAGRASATRRRWRRSSRRPPPGAGLGAELGQGSARFAARHGRPDSDDGQVPRAAGLRSARHEGQGLAFATSNRGGCHLRANMLGPEILGVPKMIDRFATLGKAGLLINMQNLNAVLDSLSLCKFTAFAMKEDYYARLLSAVAGETVEPQELLRIGERIWNAERLFNLAAGFARDDDTLPRRLREEPVAVGPAAGRVVDLPPMLDEYYIAAAGTSTAGRGAPSSKPRAAPPRRRRPELEARRHRELRRPRQFQQIGRDLFVAGLISSHGGNMSVRHGRPHADHAPRLHDGPPDERDLIETGL